ncbi:hypothetical protein PR048_020015 [Dryococelus australis]|uniref:Uncharacterized protein n=1 Tax=Dryococelus australis TaxID=614101 RepID=A0ABQ9H534_9NEOP|nr:hypothetical protein PR048_020015 [Dryococelus australis]
MGVCASYYFHKCRITKVNEEAFIRHVFDNADVNVRTLDGLNTFHAMGEYNVLRQLLALKPKFYINNYTSPYHHLTFWNQCPTRVEWLHEHH